MFYNWNDKDNLAYSRRAKVFDANGLEWDEPITKIDTETGECLCYVFDDRGMAVRTDDGDIEVKVLKIAAPCLVVFEE